MASWAIGESAEGEHRTQGEHCTEGEPTVMSSTIDLSVVDARLQELARKAVAKSGGRFLQAVLKHTTAYLEAVAAESVDEEAFEEASDVITPENLVLLARWYAGEVTQGKRKRAGVETNAYKVKAILANDAARQCLDVVFLAKYLDAAHEECEERAANAEENEHWANDYAEMDMAEVWNGRAEAIDLVKASWEEAAEVATVGDWDSLVTAVEELQEVDAE